jgi:hypothetical protein
MYILRLHTYVEINVYAKDERWTDGGNDILMSDFEISKSRPYVIHTTSEANAYDYVTLDVNSMSAKVDIDLNNCKKKIPSIAHSLIGRANSKTRCC